MTLRDNVVHGNFATTTDVYEGRAKGHVDISKSASKNLLYFL